MVSQSNICVCFLTTISRYQTHQLQNNSDDFCATVNCYRYAEYDQIHWNLFDYVHNQTDQVGNFFPNTDLTYGEMKRIVLAEWNDKMNHQTR